MGNNADKRAKVCLLSLIDFLWPMLREREKLVDLVEYAHPLRVADRLQLTVFSRLLLLFRLKKLRILNAFQAQQRCVQFETNQKNP